MAPRLLAALLLALAAPALAGQATRVELTPELGGTGTVPGLSATPLAVPLQLGAQALTPTLALSAPSLTAPVLQAPALVPGATPAAAKPAIPTLIAPAALKPVVPAAAKGGAPETLLKTLSMPALDLSKVGVGDSAGAAEKDFNSRAQLGETAALGDGVLPAPSADAQPSGGGKVKLSLVKAAKHPTTAPLTDPGALPLDVAPTAARLKDLTSDGSSFLVTLGSDGKWRMSRRESRDAYPTPEEVDAANGAGGRHFVASKSGLVEWNPNAPAKLAVSVASSLWQRAALRVPLLHPFVLLRGGVAAESISWKKAEADGLSAGPQPLNARLVIETFIPPLVASELPIVAAKLGRPLDDAHRADVLKRTNGYRLYWHSATTYKDHPDNVGIPDGHFRSDFGIRLMVKPDWRKIPNLEANYRPLFSHEYTHWLQHEGFVSYKYGGEIAAVAVEVLRAIEVLGLDRVRAGEAATVHPGVLSSFDGGREWARRGLSGDGSPYSKGALAGAAYEAAQVTGRPEAAWEFLNLVIAGEKAPHPALEPAEAWARVVGAK